MARAKVLRTRATMDVVGDLPRASADRRAQADRTVAALARAATGDQSAFAEFYDDVAAVVYGTVVRIVRNEAMAEEVTQDVFVELWRHAPRFDPSRGSPRTWAAMIAHRRAVDRVRAESAARARELADARTAPREHDAVADAVATGLDRAEVVAALDRLSATQREALHLAYYRGCTYREVAVTLGVPEGTVKTRIRDGLIKLRGLMGVAT